MKSCLSHAAGTRVFLYSYREKWDGGNASMKLGNEAVQSAAGRRSPLALAIHQLATGEYHLPRARTTDTLRRLGE